MIMNWLNRMRGDHANGGTGHMPSIPGRASVDGSSPAAPLIDADETLTGELGRARRYEQPLAIVTVSPVPLELEKDGDADGNAPERRRHGILPLLTAAGLREALRESDVLCYQPTEDLFVLGLPQSDVEAATCAMRRVGTLFRDRLHIELVAGMAEFPTDGLTLEDLMATARGRAEPVAAAAEGSEADAPRDISSQRVATRPRPQRPHAGSTTGMTREALGGE